MIRHLALVAQTFLSVLLGLPFVAAAFRSGRFCGCQLAAQSYSSTTLPLRHSDRNDPASAICHPDRSGPIFSSAPLCGASGRAVEGSWQDLNLFAIDGFIPPNAPHASPGAPGTECVPGSWVSLVAQTLLSVLLGLPFVGTAVCGRPLFSQWSHD